LERRAGGGYDDDDDINGDYDYEKHLDDGAKYMTMMMMMMMMAMTI
jgi:hypothetical protein